LPQLPPGHYDPSAGQNKLECEKWPYLRISDAEVESFHIDWIRQFINFTEDPVTTTAKQFDGRSPPLFFLTVFS